MHAQWKANLVAYMRAVANRNADQWIARATGGDIPIVEPDEDARFGEEAGAVKYVNRPVPSTANWCPTPPTTRNHWSTESPGKRT